MSENEKTNNLKEETELKTKGDTALKAPETALEEVHTSFIAKEYVYEHKTQYYETDQMGIIHHSNYIKWLEELRTDLLGKIGCEYSNLEKVGILIPVLSVSCNYLKIVHFGDTVQIKFHVTKYNGVKFELEYEIYNKATGELCTTASTAHCFLDTEGSPLFMQKSFPKVHQRLLELLL